MLDCSVLFLVRQTTTDKSMHKIWIDTTVALIYWFGSTLICCHLNPQNYSCNLSQSSATYMLLYTVWIKVCSVSGAEINKAFCYYLMKWGVYCRKKEVLMWASKTHQEREDFTYATVALGVDRCSWLSMTSAADWDFIQNNITWM